MQISNFKGTHTVYFSISFHILNQKPTVPITFYCIKTWVAHFLDCKHKYMMKTRAPPDRVGVLHCLLPIEFHKFKGRIYF